MNTIQMSRDELIRELEQKRATITMLLAQCCELKRENNKLKNKVEKVYRALKN